MPVEFIYRSSKDPKAVTRRVVVNSIAASNGSLMGCTTDHKGRTDLRAKELSRAEREAWEKRNPGQEVFEMGVFDPYVSIYDDLQQLGHTRSPAPSKVLGRGGTRRTVVSQFVDNVVDMGRYGLKVQTPAPNIVF